MDYKTKAGEDAILLVEDVLGLIINGVAAFLGVDRRTLLRYRKHQNSPFACDPGESGKTSHYHPAPLRDLR